MDLTVASSSDSNVASRNSSTDAVRAVFAAGRELTDAELVRRLPDFHRGQVIPARIRLERWGEVELAGKNAAGHNVWRSAPPERRAEARQASEQRRKTPAEKLARLKPAARAQVVAALLADEEVNRILRSQSERSRAWRAARARAHDSHAESEAERRERKRELREAEKKNYPYLDFLKVHDALRDSVSALIGIRSFMRDELERRERGEDGRIPPDRWPAVGQNLTEVVELSGALWHDLALALEASHDHCPLCGARTGRDRRALEEGYIEAHAEEYSDDDAELIDDREGA
jgi:hypothetical protein